MIDETHFLPFALPEIGPEEIQEVVATLQSGWITTGPKAKHFEEAFASYLGGHAQTLAVNSATSGLHLALEAIGIQPGDEVIVPTYTFTSTAEVVHYLGAHPIVVDIDPMTYNIDPKAICQAITSKTKAIIPVHFAGLACDMEAIFAIAQEHRLRVVEDAAHAFPTTFNGQLVGTLSSDATVFSFYATKTITTGEGGMIATTHPDIFERCKVMRLHGISKDAFDRYISSSAAWYYEVTAPGFKYNMPDIAAAIGIQQLAKIDRFYKRRVALAERYDQELSALPLTLPPRAKTADKQAWHLYPVQLDPAIDRGQFIKQMAELGIGCSVHFIPLHRQPFWRNTYRLNPASFPCAESLFHHEVSLPLYTRMTDQDQSRVIDAIQKICQHQTQLL